MRAESALEHPTALPHLALGIGRPIAVTLFTYSFLDNLIAVDRPAVRLRVLAAWDRSQYTGERAPPLPARELPIRSFAESGRTLRRAGRARTISI